MRMFVKFPDLIRQTDYVVVRKGIFPKHIRCKNMLFRRPGAVAEIVPLVFEL